MDDASDLRDFEGVCRLFPLPGVAQLPHSVLPLHIFEPRYRQMMEDALATDELITIVQLRSADEVLPSGARAVEPVGCLGKILKYERLPDGRFNLLLRGLARVRLIEEIPSSKLYRLCRAEILADVDDAGSESTVHRTVQRFREFLTHAAGEIPEELDALFRSEMPPGPLSDVMGHAMPFSAKLKQLLLNEASVAARIEMIDRFLDPFLAAAAGVRSPRSGYPPKFSEN